MEVILPVSEKGKFIQMVEGLAHKPSSSARACTNDFLISCLGEPPLHHRINIIYSFSAVIALYY